MRDAGRVQCDDGRSTANRRFYDNEAGQYDELRWSSAGGAWTDKVQKEIIRGMLGRSTNQNVLELAIGTGRIGIDLAQNGWRVTGIDMALNMLRQAQRKGSDSQRVKDFNLIQATTTQIPVASESVSLCLCINALSLMPECEPVLKEISRVMKPGGVFICNFANLLSYYLPVGLIVNSRSRALGRDVYCQWYRLSALRRLFEHVGFEISEMRGHVNFPNHRSAKMFFPLVKTLDKVSRDSFLRRLCPSLFFKLVKR